jgi:hypothetical protein
VLHYRRLGSRGFSWLGTIPPTQRGATSIPRARAGDAVIRGAHFDPFDQQSLGTDIPALYLERNQGLVLSRQLQLTQVQQQMALVMDLEGRIDWLAENIETAVMGAELRARKGKNGLPDVTIHYIASTHVSICCFRRCASKFDSREEHLHPVVAK